MSKSKKKDQQNAERIKPRNPVATHPLLKKGGQHGKDQKAKRRQNKVALKKGDFDFVDPVKKVS